MLTFSNQTPVSLSGVHTINVLSIEAESNDMGCVKDPSPVKLEMKVKIGQRNKLSSTRGSDLKHRDLLACVEQLSSDNLKRATRHRVIRPFAHAQTLNRCVRYR